MRPFHDELFWQGKLTDGGGMAEKTNKLTVGLIRADLTELDEIVKPDVQGIAVEEVGTFFTERSRPRPPDWITDFFGNVLGDNLGIITSSAKGVLLVPVADGNVTRTFAVIFGHGLLIAAEK